MSTEAMSTEPAAGREFRPLPKSDAGYEFNERVAVRVWHDGRFVTAQSVDAVRYAKADGSPAFALSRMHAFPEIGSEIADADGNVYVVARASGRAPVHHCVVDPRAGTI